MVVGPGHCVPSEIGSVCVGLDSEGAESRGTVYNIGKGRLFCVSSPVVQGYTLARTPGDGTNTLQVRLLDARDKACISLH